jgi:hypothetical protein
MEGYDAGFSGSIGGSVELFAALISRVMASFHLRSP